MSLATVAGRLSRAEMRNVMAGSGSSSLSCNAACVENSDCNAGKKCKEKPCVEDPNQTTNYCVAD